MKGQGVEGVEGCRCWKGENVGIASKEGIILVGCAAKLPTPF